MLKESFDLIRKLLREGVLSEAIRQLRTLLDSYRDGTTADKLDGIEEEYKLMLGYMLKGYRDPERENLYERLLDKTNRLTNDYDLSLRKKLVSSYVEAAGQALHEGVTTDDIRRRLESFVTDVALTGLQSDENENTHIKKLRQEHQQFMNSLFNKIWTSPAWDEHEGSFYRDLILSPSIDITDAKWMTAAVMLGCMNIFDFEKFNTLTFIYLHATDIRLKQRAFVGWALSLFVAPGQHGKVKELVEKMCDDGKTRSDLLELQKQIYFCLNAESDHEEIQRDIMPNIMRNNHFEISRFGIVEKEEDEMQNILNPGASDKAMEELERSMRKMADKQNAGADIYFGGFSHMKNYSFFFHLSNWFVPFTPQHPEIIRLSEQNTQFMLIRKLFQTGPFCDSDKYSFTLSMISIFDKIPANMREVLAGQDNIMGGPFLPNDQESDTYARRMYLQDLYRFFRLYKKKEDFFSPFPVRQSGNGKENLFLLDVFKDTDLHHEVEQLALFLMKQKKLYSLQLLLEHYENVHSVSLDYLRGTTCLRNGENTMAERFFKQVLSIQPDHEQALSGLAKSVFRQEKYEETDLLYQQLTSDYPQKKHYQLHHAICLLKLDKTEQALQILFRLNYEQPEDMAICRILAWGLLMAKKPAQAENYYQKILSSGQTALEDKLNEGYAHWISGDIQGAVDAMKEFLKRQPQHQQQFSFIMGEFRKDVSLLDKYDISATECQLMAELVTDNKSIPSSSSL